MFEIDGTKLKFQPEVLDFIVDKAIEFKLGARGLRSIVESIMMEKMYETPSSKPKTLTITLEYAKKQIDKVASKIANSQQ